MTAEMPCSDLRPEFDIQKLRALHKSLPVRSKAAVAGQCRKPYGNTSIAGKRPGQWWFVLDVCIPWYQLQHAACRTRYSSSSSPLSAARGFPTSQTQRKVNIGEAQRDKGAAERALQMLLNPIMLISDKWDVTSALKVSGLDLFCDPQIIRIFAARAAVMGEDKGMILGWRPGGGV